MVQKGQLKKVGSVYDIIFKLFVTRKIKNDFPNVSHLFVNSNIQWIV